MTKQLFQRPRLAPTSRGFHQRFAREPTWRIALPFVIGAAICAALFGAAFMLPLLAR